MYSLVLTLSALVAGVASLPSAPAPGWEAGWRGPIAETRVGPDGTLEDTAEVAAARAAHLAALEAARAANPDHGDGHYHPAKYGDDLHDHHDHGHLDLAEQAKQYAALAAGVDQAAAWVAQSSQAKAQDEALWRAKTQARASAEAAWSASQGGVNSPWSGPLASPSLLDSGYLADTAEVAAARAKHLAALSEASARWTTASAPGLAQWD